MFETERTCSNGKGTRDEEGEFTTKADSWATTERDEFLNSTQGLLVPVFLKCSQIEGSEKRDLFRSLEKQGSENTMLTQHGFSFIQRSGRNSSASSPHRSLRRCIAAILKAIVVPSVTKIGEFPSGPPPRGRMVS